MAAARRDNAVAKPALLSRCDVDATDACLGQPVPTSVADSAQNLLDDLCFLDTGQSLIEALEADGQPAVVDPQ